MSVVIYGVGIGLDSGSTIVAMGLARDLGGGETVESAMATAGIENLFVIDYGTGRRKMTRAEYRKYKELMQMMQSGRISFYEKKAKHGRQFALVREPIIRVPV